MSESSDKSYYDTQQAKRSDTQYAAYINTNLAIFKQFKQHLAPYIQGKSGLEALEVGAGTCALALAISEFDEITNIYCTDISAERMKQYMPESAPLVKGCQPNKLHFDEMDMNIRFPFEDGSLDLILFDAALHHSRAIWETLDECHRVLKPDGLIASPREQYLSPWRESQQINYLLGSEEVKSGVSENIYLKRQYAYYLRACGFKPNFVAYYTRPIKKLLRPLNGRLFSDWMFYAVKAEKPCLD